MEMIGDTIVVDKKGISEVLKSASFAMNVRRIRFSAPCDEITCSFGEFLKLEEVELPEGLERIGEKAFCGCKSLKHVTFPMTLRCIDEKAFKGCESLEDFVLPERLMSIGERAFRSCTSLRTLVLPKSLTFVGNSAFADCTGLESVEIQSSFVSDHRVTPWCGRSYWVKETGVFVGCTALRRLFVADGVTRLPAGSFSGCAALTEVRLPESLGHVGGGTFRDVPAFVNYLRVVKDSDGLVLRQAYNFKGDLVVPAGVRSIEKLAFEDASVKSISFADPQSVIQIGESAFRKYHGAPVTLPPSVTFVDVSGFKPANRVLHSSRCSFRGEEGKCARYVVEDYDKITGIIRTCTEILSVKKPDVNRFVRAINGGADLGIWCPVGQDWRTVLLQRIPGVAKIVNANSFCAVEDSLFDDYLECVLSDDVDELRSGRRMVRLVADLLEDSKSNADPLRTRKLALFRGLIARRLRQGWNASTKCPELCETVALANGRKSGALKDEWKRIRAAETIYYGWNAKGWDDEEIEGALSEDQVARFMLRFELLAREIDAPLIGYMLGKQARRCLRTLYEQSPDRVGELLQNFILNIVVSDPSDSILRRLPEIQGLYGKVRDSFGCSPLVYAILNPRLESEADGQLDENHPILRKLVDWGCDLYELTPLGFSVAELLPITAWEPSADKCAERHDQERSFDATQPATDDSVVPERVVEESPSVEQQPISFQDSASDNRAEQYDPNRFFDAARLANDDGVVPERAAEGNSSIERLWVPKAVTGIGMFAFHKCENLKEVLFEEGLEPSLTIGLMSFADCKNLERVALPGRLSFVGRGAFRDCPSLRDLTMDAHSSRVNVSEHVFDNCPGREWKLWTLKTVCR